MAGSEVNGARLALRSRHPQQGTADATAKPTACDTAPVLPPATRGAITVLIADAQATYAYGLSALLAVVAPDVRVVAVACTPDAARAELLAGSPDVVALGVHHAGAHAGASLREIVSCCPRTRVLVLLAEVEDAEAAELMRLGAHGCLSKDVEVDQLVCALRLVHSGSAVVDRSALDSVLGGAGPTGKVVLSPPERDLLRLVLEGLANAEIARRMAVSESTLKRTLHRLVVKLQARDRVHAALSAMQQGLL